MTIDRRTLLAASLALPAAPALALPTAAPEVVPLWSGDAPGLTNPALTENIVERDPGGIPNRYVEGIRRPRLEVVRPAKPNGAAMLVIPGGGYQRVVIDREGYEIGRWLADRGVTAFILFYRLPGEGWKSRADAPLADAQRAMRLIRARAGSYGIDPARVGVVGFSAGGHLCADLAVRYMRQVYDPVDAADRLDARPLLAAPIYPVVSMDESIAHMRSRAQLLGDAPTATMLAEHSPDRQVSAATPPIFLVHANDDTNVKAANSIVLHAACRQAGVPVEMHLFEKGSHGFGWGRSTQGKPVHLWPELLLSWAGTHGLMGGGTGSRS